MCLKGDITLRPETQENVHSPIISADDEESLVAMIMRANPIINVNELCIVDYVDLKVGKQSKLFSAERCSGHFIYEGIVFFSPNFELSSSLC